MKPRVVSTPSGPASALIVSYSDCGVKIAPEADPLLLRPGGVAGDHRHLVDQQQLGKPVGAVQVVVVPDHRAAHRVAEDVDLVEVQRLDRVVHVLGQPADLVAELGLVGLAVAAQVERDHAVAIGEAVELVPELLGGLRPARDHQDRLARARFQVIEADAVAGRDVADLARQLRLRGAAGHRRGEAIAAVSATAPAPCKRSRRVPWTDDSRMVDVSLIVMVAASLLAGIAYQWLCTSQNDPAGGAL